MPDELCMMSAIDCPHPPDADRLFEQVYEKLHRIASSHMGQERLSHTLQPTALVHEVYLRMIGQHASWESQRHFFAAAAEAMRRILIDHARRRQALRRGGDRARVELSDAEPTAENLPDLLVLDEALLRLEKEEPRMAEVVKLRFFAGLSIADTAKVMGLSPMTVKRTWACAHAWLHGEVFDEA
jgi:RNA polymerase sigma factor (TIGR02999 family)